MSEVADINELIKVLYADDDAGDRALICRAMADHERDFEVTEASSRQSLEAQLARADEYDVVLSEIDVSGFAGVGVVDAVRAVRPGLPVIIVTRSGSEEIAAEAFRRGAAEYVIKSPGHLKRLPDTVQAVLASSHPVDRNRQLQTSPRVREGFLQNLLDSVPDDVRGIRELAQSEAKWRALTVNSPDHVMMLDLDGTIVFLNHTVDGLKPDEVLGNTVYHTVPRQEIAQVEQCLAKVLRTGDIGSYEINYEHRDGRRRFLASTVAPIRREGQVVGFVVSSRDVTDLKRTEGELRISERFFRSTFNALLSHVAIVDEAGVIVSVNNAWRSCAR